MSTLYLRSYRENEHGKRIPTSILITATTAQSTTSDTNVFHWHIYFSFDGQSVLFDIIPGADLRTGVLMVMSQEVPRTTCLDALEYVAQPTSQYTIQNYIKFFIDNRLDKYIYDESGSGCRWWCTTVLGKLEEAGLVSSGTKASFLSWVADQAQQLPLKIPMLVRKGEFY